MKEKYNISFYRDKHNLTPPSEQNVVDLEIIAEEFLKQMTKCEVDECEISFEYKNQKYIVSAFREPECNKDCDNCPLNEENGKCEDDE